MNTDIEKNEIPDFSRKFITDFLIAQERPVMENVLLRTVCRHHGFEISERDLFILHFCLFSALYEIKQASGINNYYLNIDPMRIRLISVPEEGCLHYFPETGHYCRKKRIDFNFCDEHFKNYISNLPEFDGLRDFYLNKENISLREDRIFKKIYRGMVLYSLKTAKVAEALRFFGVSKDEIQKLPGIYHKLARKYHPDISETGGEMMKRINSHYQLLNEIFSF